APIKPPMTFKHPSETVVKPHLESMQLCLDRINNRTLHDSMFVDVVVQLTLCALKGMPGVTSPFTIPLWQVRDVFTFVDEIRSILFTTKLIEAKLFHVYRGLMLSAERRNFTDEFPTA